jgi:hypothetical protein
MLTKTRFWQLAALLLLLLNLFQVLRRPPRPDANALKNRVVSILQLDAAQIAQYETLIGQHRSTIQAKEGEILAAKKQLYGLLAGSEFSTKDSLINHIGDLQSDIEQIHFDHFSALKSICRPDQMAGFQKIGDEMLHFLSPKRMPKPPGK